jgi:hypothetical protein
MHVGRVSNAVRAELPRVGSLCESCSAKVAIEGVGLTLEQLNNVTVKNVAGQSNGSN